MLKEREVRELAAMVDLRAQNRAKVSTDYDGVCCTRGRTASGSMLRCRLCFDLIHRKSLVVISNVLFFAKHMPVYSLLFGHRYCWLGDSKSIQPIKIVLEIITKGSLPQWLSWLRHSAHRPGRSIGGCRGSIPGSTGRFRVRISGAHAFEINFSGRQRGLDGVLYNL